MNGIALQEFPRNNENSGDSSRSTLVGEQILPIMDETRSLDWEDFEEIPKEKVVDNDSLIDREHLVSFAKSYEGDCSDSGSSVFSRTSDEVSRWRLKMKLRRTSSDSWKLAYVSDSESSSVSATVRCAEIAESRKRSVSVTENILEVTGKHHSVLQQEEEDDDVYEEIDLNTTNTDDDGDDVPTNPLDDGT